jgi:hypothetical protein
VYRFEYLYENQKSDETMACSLDRKYC